MKNLEGRSETIISASRTDDGIVQTATIICNWYVKTYAVC